MMSRTAATPPHPTRSRFCMVHLEPRLCRTHRIRPTVEALGREVPQLVRNALISTTGDEELSQLRETILIAVMKSSVPLVVLHVHKRLTVFDQELCDPTVFVLARHVKK